MITFDIEQSLVPKRERFTDDDLQGIASGLDEVLKKAVTGIISVSFVDDEEIRRLNRMYRKKDSVTDVLSFAEPNGERSGYLGDVIISYPQAVRQMADGDWELERTDLLVHGILHILGFDHEKAEDAQEMFPRQDAIVSKVL